MGESIRQAGERRDDCVAAQTRGPEDKSERPEWMRRWAEGWLETLKDRPPERYYADLPLEVACDMILELTETT